MSKRSDRKGTKRGRLTFIEIDHIKNQSAYWKCKCDCGNYCVVKGSGYTRSCGCLVHETRIKNGKNRAIKKNVVGKKFGRLIVISETDERKHKQILWLCKCDCGNFKLVTISHLLQGGVQSCGCLQKEIRIQNGKNRKGLIYTHRKNYIHKRFGKLIVVKEIEKKEDGRRLFTCKCDCGNYCNITSHQLENGGTRSCGCLVKELLTKNKTPKERTQQGKINKLKAELCHELDITWDEAEEKVNNIISKTLKEMS